MNCSKCGNELRGGDKFCGMCGTPVEKKESTNTIVQNLKEGNEPNNSLVGKKSINSDKKKKYNILIYACTALLCIFTYFANNSEDNGFVENSSYDSSNSDYSSDSDNSNSQENTEWKKYVGTHELTLTNHDPNQGPTGYAGSVIVKINYDKSSRVIYTRSTGFGQTKTVLDASYEDIWMEGDLLILCKNGGKLSGSPKFYARNGYLYSCETEEMFKKNGSSF